MGFSSVYGWYEFAAPLAQDPITDAARTRAEAHPGKTDTRVATPTRRAGSDTSRQSPASESPSA